MFFRITVLKIYYYYTRIPKIKKQKKSANMSGFYRKCWIYFLSSSLRPSFRRSETT